MSLYLKVGRECSMTQKDLAEAYLAKAKENAIYFKDGSFPNIPLFQGNDIKAAFNAGRESVVENILKLMWKDIEDYRISYAITPFGDYSILWSTTDNFTIYFNGKHLKLSATKLQQAKQAANEHYKKQIKQALWL